jgi:ComF family protein
MIKDFKYNRASWLAEDFADLLEGAVRAHLDGAAVDALFPVPLHPNRLRSRGYNQAALLARALARRLGRRCDEKSLARIRDTPKQSLLNGVERRKNLTGAFAATRPTFIRGRIILLIDDVTTTGSTLAAALGGAEVCHLDASKGMVQWARDNAALNGLQDHPIRWIVDDVHKFLRREFRRERRYDAVILDPPTFGRGASGETYKIERDLQETLALVKGVLSDRPRFVLFSSHTPGLSCQVAENVLAQAFAPVRVESGEMLLEGSGRPCPSGIYCRCEW